MKNAVVISSLQETNNRFCKTCIPCGAEFSAKRLLFLLSDFASGAEPNEPDEVVEGGDHVWSAESPAAVAARRVVAAEGRRRRQQRRERDARSGRIAGAREKFRNSHIIFHIGPIASIHT